MKESLEILKEDWFIIKNLLLRFCEKFSTSVVKFTENKLVFVVSFISIILWFVSGFLCNFSDSWEKLMTCVTGSIIFLMIFIVQQTQSKDTMSLHLKLNELIAATKGASNKVLNIEDMSSEELISLKEFYLKLSSKEEKSGICHTIDEISTNG